MIQNCEYFLQRSVQFVPNMTSTFLPNAIFILLSFHFSRRLLTAWSSHYRKKSDIELKFPTTFFHKYGFHNFFSPENVELAENFEIENANVGIGRRAAASDRREVGRGRECARLQGLSGEIHCQQEKTPLPVCQCYSPFWMFPTNSYC